MKYCIMCLFLLAFQPLMAQPASMEAVAGQKATLVERYQIMKSKSETFGEYKVIKEFVLDGVWRITQDSIRANTAMIRDLKGTISTLQTDLHTAQEAFRQKEASMEEMVYASTHISVFGINFDKRLFIGMVILIVLGLLLLMGMITGKLKLMYFSVKEKVELINATSSELEEYKRKSLEKFTKLSRELQNERNKLMELKRT